MRQKLAPVRTNSWTDKSVTLGIHKDVYFTRNGAAEIGYEVNLPSALEVSIENRDLLKKAKNVVLSQAMPVGTRGRYIIENRSMTADDVRSMTLDPQACTPMLRTLVEEDNKSMERDRRAGQLKKVRQFFTVKIDRKVSKGGSLSERARDALTDYANSYGDRLYQSLNAAGLRAMRMGSQEMAGLVYRYRNPNFSDLPSVFRSVTPTGNATIASLQANPHLDLPSARRQLTESSVDKSNPGYLLVGTRYVNVVNWSEAGDGTQSGMLEALMATLSEVDYNIVIDWVIPDQVKAKALLNYLQDGARQNTEDMGGAGNSALLDEMNEALYAIKRGRATVVKFGFSVVIYAKSLEELNHFTSLARAEIGQMGGGLARIGNVENIKQFELLEPFNGQTNQYLFDGRTINVAGLLPQVGAWEGTTDPLMVFRNRWNGLTPINHGVGTNNSGMFIIGSAGSGKSNLNMSILLNMRAVGSKIYLLDLKNDYDDVVIANEGSIIEMRPGARLPSGEYVCINMFDLPEGDLMPSSEKRQMLMGMFRALLYESGGFQLLDHTILTSAIEAAYQNALAAEPIGNGEVIQTHTPFYLSDFVTLLRRLPTIAGRAPSQKEREAIDLLASRLSAFTGTAEMAPFLDGPTTVKITNEVTSFNISAMRDESARALRRIGMLLLVDAVWRDGLNHAQLIKYAVFEELGAMAEIEEAATFVAEIFKVGRSYRFFPVGISQEIGDIEKMKGIINNSALVFIGKVQPGEAEKIVDTLKLNQAIHDNILSLGGGTSYREYVALLYLSNNQMVGDVIQNHLTTLKHWMTTTTPVDKIRREKYTERLNGNRMGALMALAGLTDHAA
ncbi:VirB4 family type IV secretion system protein [Deinococcus xinjiangensis]